jgi:hypothetical protein
MLENFVSADAVKELRFVTDMFNEAVVLSKFVNLPSAEDVNVFKEAVEACTLSNFVLTDAVNELNVVIGVYPPSVTTYIVFAFNNEPEAKPAYEADVSVTIKSTAGTEGYISVRLDITEPEREPERRNIEPVTLTLPLIN